ncbi:hypothetical protein F4802DRAFT_618671 [Xylaria palmicola]|nr:hypothetical protein F4802DRAFT_618671 [Xylaria palmicola]
MRLITPVALLSLAGVGLADCGVEGGTIVVDNPNGFSILDELETCSTVYGNILIDPAFVYFILQGPQEITGTITAHDNTILKFFWLQDVRRLGGLSLANPQISARVNVTALEEIGTMEWKDIFWHYTDDFFEFHAPNLKKISSLNVESTDLSGFAPDYVSWDGSFYYEGLQKVTTADNIRVVRNRRMDNVVFPALKSISESLVVADNVNNFPSEGSSSRMLISFPALESVGSVSIYDSRVYRSSLGGKINLPILSHVFGDFNVSSVKGVRELAVPALKEVDGSIHVVGNKGLYNLNFPELRKADRIILEGGNNGFETISFPSLEEVGAFHVSSAARGFDCSSLDYIKKIATEFSCSTKNTLPSSWSSFSHVPTPTPSSHVPTSAPSSHSSLPIPTSTRPGGPVRTCSAFIPNQTAP